VTTSRIPRPAFQSIELDPIDARLEARAAQKGIPTLVTPKAEPHAEVQPRAAAAASEVPAAPKASRGPAKDATPRARMKPAKIELPDYVWLALKIRAAENMVSLRYLIMVALRAQGIPINDADMIEDGRRFRD
jgi:hypothetical protein